MEIDCNSKSPLDWDHLLPADSTDDDDDRPPELVVKSEYEITENQMIDELMKKSDGEITESIARSRKTLQTMGDKGEKVKANLWRHEQELERRKKLKSDKANKGCEETIQLSDHSDDGGEKKSASMFANLFHKQMEEDEKDSRTVDAFEKDSSYVIPCQRRKSKSMSQILGNGRFRMRLSSSRSPATSNDDNKDGDYTTSFSEPNSPQDPPSRNLRPRSRHAYHLLDMDPPMKKFMANLDPCMKDVNIYYPSRDDPDAVEVNYADMECLGPEACISSTIMNFYIRYLQQPSSSSESATCNYHFFNTYFYNKLEKLSYEEDSFLKFRKWWKGVCIFEKAYILLPVHENAHWSLVIICLPNKEDELGPLLLHLDSLGLHNSMSLFTNIIRFLKEEWSHLRKSESPVSPPVVSEIWENLDHSVDLRTVTVPQQKNDYDCGLFVLFYMERFIKDAPERFKEKDLSMFGRQWFRSQVASKLRGKIYDLLVEQFKKAKDC